MTRTIRINPPAQKPELWRWSVHEKSRGRRILPAAVPRESRASHREPVLGPLATYHTEHLVHTVRVFLDCSGSWKRGAAAAPGGPGMPGGAGAVQPAPRGVHDQFPSWARMSST
jgi:hypothetical protein